MKQESRDKHTAPPAGDRRAQRLKAALKANIARRKAQAARRRLDDAGQEPGADDTSAPGITTTDRNAAR